LLKNLLLLINPCSFSGKEIDEIEVFMSKLQDVDAGLCQLALEWVLQGQGKGLRLTAHSCDCYLKRLSGDTGEDFKG